MTATVAPASAASPLGRLPRDDRERVIASVARDLRPEEAAAVLAALAGTDDEVAALPDALQDAAQIAILAAFPPGHGAVTVSRLGLAPVATESWLPAIRERFSGMGVAAAADALQDILRRRDAGADATACERDRRSDRGRHGP